MPVYVISYDLKKPGQDYTELHEAIKNIGSWWHHLDSTWLVDTDLTPEQIWQKLDGKIDQNDLLLIHALKPGSQGWLTQKAWNWISKHVK